MHQNRDSTREWVRSGNDPCVKGRRRKQSIKQTNKNGKKLCFAVMPPFSLWRDFKKSLISGTNLTTFCKMRDYQKSYIEQTSTIHHNCWNYLRKHKSIYLTFKLKLCIRRYRTFSQFWREVSEKYSSANLISTVGKLTDFMIKQE